MPDLSAGELHGLAAPLVVDKQIAARDTTKLYVHLTVCGVVEPQSTYTTPRLTP